MPIDGGIIEASFISPNAASYIASTYTAAAKGQQPSMLSLNVSALRDLNAFLDYFLAIIIKETRSTNLQDLKSTLARVLDSALGYVALNEAQAELETYRNQETDAGRRFDYDKQNNSGTDYFDVEAVWLQARVRCMIYSTVGEKEEGDFEVLPEETSVTPPVAIFLTAILEFLGEHILLTSARFARERMGPSARGLLTQEDLDKGIRMDKVLGTIWQSYLAILPGRGQGLRRDSNSETVDSAPTERVFSTLPFGTSGGTTTQASTSQYEQPSSLWQPPRSPTQQQTRSPSISSPIQGVFSREANPGPGAEPGLGRFNASESDPLETIPEAVPPGTKRPVVEPGLVSVAPLSPVRGNRTEEDDPTHDPNIGSADPDLYESSVFQWNSRRKSLQAPLPGANTDQLPPPNDADSPFQQPDLVSPIGFVGTPQDQPESPQSPDVIVTPRTSVSTGMVSPRANLTPNRKSKGISQAAKLTGVSGFPIPVANNVDPDSDYGTFLRSEVVRENNPTIASEAEARRQRIIAARHAALAQQTVQPTLSELESQMQSQPSTPTAPSRPAISARASSSSQRESNLSQTLHLAAFLRNTGPRANDSTTSQKSPKVKSRRASTKSPKIEGDWQRNEADLFDDTDSTKSTKRPRGQSLVEFLNKGPASTASDSNSRALSLHTARVDPSTPKRLQTADQDTIIAGPAYAQLAPPLQPTTRADGGHDVEGNQSANNRTVKHATTKLKLGSPRSPVATANGAPVDSEDEDDSEDEAIFGRPRRKPPVKESLAEFLQNSAPPNYQAPTPSSPQKTGTATSGRPLSKIGKRLSSLSILVGVSPRKAPEDPVVPSNPATQSRPNHRPLME